MELPGSAEPSSSSGSGGRVERPPRSPVAQHSESQRDGGTAEEWDPVVTCPEHRPRLGQEPLLSPTSVVIMMD